MKKIVKQYWWGLLLGFLAIIIIPVILQWMMISIFNNTSGGSNDGWLGFWGGYLGSALGVAGTVAFTIYYSDKQLEINREAQVQAYVKQSQIKALRDYEVSMYDAYKQFNDASFNFESSDHKRKTMKELHLSYIELKDKFLKYRLLTSADKSVVIEKIQDNLETRFKELWKSGVITLGNERPRSVTDDEGQGILHYQTDQAIEEEADRFNDFARYLLESANEVKNFFNNTFK
ncbi:hypothetical protein [Lactiplantibacillus plantarum]|uniref:hypothetical protein n=1 Tax=Lactiplantibacillus plantarum TaxID=1590 RepID=UPI0015EC7FD6|nr:hypothetical protein [Lactiplantibacillus plantarum]QLQ49170.1 hypothetical protein H0E85_10645 [Lactiplantibacillus plantarum]WDQ19912.1 hypothetical protein PTW40_09205 [Lactiplantibacillus plantarum]BEI53970.1 hypothetical protein AWA2045_21010 [Lactiplantibacillus plantarum]